MIKFNKYHVIDTETKTKARIFYSLGKRTDGRHCVTLYSKDYDRNLGKLFPEAYSNNTDIMTDYFDQGRVDLFEDHPLYGEARIRAEAILNGSPRQERNSNKIIPEIKVIQESIQFYENMNQTSRMIEMECGKHKSIVQVSIGKYSPFVNVVLSSSASHQAFKGLGKFFHTFKEAISHYRTPEIQEMIKFAINKSQLCFNLGENHAKQ